MLIPSAPGVPQGQSSSPTSSPSCPSFQPHPQSIILFIPATLRQAIALAPPRTFRSPITSLIKNTPSDDLASGSLVPLFIPSCSSILYTSAIATRGTQLAIHVYTVVRIFAPLSYMHPLIARSAPLSSHIHNRREGAKTQCGCVRPLGNTSHSVAGGIRSCGPFTQRLKFGDSIPYFSLQHTSSRPPK